MKKPIIIITSAILVMYLLYTNKTTEPIIYSRINKEVVKSNKPYIISTSYTKKEINTKKFPMQHNVVNTMETTKYDILPTIKSNKTQSNYILKCHNASYNNYQPIFKENFVVNYNNNLCYPFEQKEISNSNVEDIVKIGEMQFVDFGNKDDLPNNPQSVPIGDGLIPLMAYAFFETAREFLHNI